MSFIAWWPTNCPTNCANDGVRFTFGNPEPSHPALSGILAGGMLWRRRRMEAIGGGNAGF
jgi:hypothetical protein